MSNITPFGVKCICDDSQVYNWNIITVENYFIPKFKCCWYSVAQYTWTFEQAQHKGDRVGAEGQWVMVLFLYMVHSTSLGLSSLTNVNPTFGRLHFSVCVRNQLWVGLRFWIALSSAVSLAVSTRTDVLSWTSYAIFLYFCGDSMELIVSTASSSVVLQIVLSVRCMYSSSAMCNHALNNISLTWWWPFDGRRLYTTDFINTVKSHINV